MSKAVRGWVEPGRAEYLQQLLEREREAIVERDEVARVNMRSMMN
ncbi:hypothetical protein ACLK17_05800 [Escherichia coli]